MLHTQALQQPTTVQHWSTFASMCEVAWQDVVGEGKHFGGGSGFHGVETTIETGAESRANGTSEIQMQTTKPQYPD